MSVRGKLQRGVDTVVAAGFVLAFCVGVSVQLVRWIARAENPDPRIADPSTN